MIRLIVSAMSLGTSGHGLPFFSRHLCRPRLRSLAEPGETVRWAHASLPGPFPQWLAIRHIRCPKRLADGNSEERRLCVARRRIGMSLRRLCFHVNPSAAARGKCDRGQACHAPDSMLSGSCSTFVLSTCPAAEKAGKTGWVRTPLDRSGGNTYISGSAGWDRTSARFRSEAAIRS
jgi:hypothetical protein